MRCSSFKSGFSFVYSIALGCIYTESKGYPREPAAHVAIRKCPIEMVFLGYGIYIHVWSFSPTYFVHDSEATCNLENRDSEAFLGEAQG
jgi:hypothetical protein